MISQVLNMIRTLKLSITQWVILSLAAVIGYLLIRLSLQDRALKRTETALLASHIASQVVEDDKAVSNATLTFTEALNAYLKAQGGSQ